MNKQNEIDLKNRIVLEITSIHNDDFTKLVSDLLSIEGAENWESAILDDRQVKEVAFSQIYAHDFAHGTAGHNQYILIAKLADALDAYEEIIERIFSNNT